MLTIRDALREKKARQEERNKVFDIFVRRISDRIRETIQRSPEICFVTYAVPSMVFGKPLYNVAECTTYLLNSFESRGFICKNLGQNTLLVSWDVGGSGTASSVAANGGTQAYRPTTVYRPSGSFVYGSGVLDTIQRRATVFKR